MKKELLEKLNAQTVCLEHTVKFESQNNFFFFLSKVIKKKKLITVNIVFLMNVFPHCLFFKQRKLFVNVINQSSNFYG